MTEVTLPLEAIGRASAKLNMYKTTLEIKLQDFQEMYKDDPSHWLIISTAQEIKEIDQAIKGLLKC